MTKPSVLILGAAGHSVEVAVLPAFYHWQNEGRLGNIVAMDKRLPEHYSAADSGLTFVVGDALQYNDLRKAVARLESNTVICYCAVPFHIQAQVLTVLSRVIQTYNTDALLLALEKPVSVKAPIELPSLFQQVLFHPICYVDHYLGKLMNSGPPLFNPTPLGISKVVIEALEADPVDFSRLESWNRYGILGDMVQSHLLQLLACVLAPLSKAEFISSLYPSHVTLGIYTTYGDRLERAVGHPTTATETFADINLDSTLLGMPNMHIVVGKGLREKRTRVELFLEDETQISTALPSLSYRDYIPVIEAMVDKLEGLPSRSSPYGSIFVNPEEILAAWDLIDRLYSFPYHKISYKLGEMIA